MLKLRRLLIIMLFNLILFSLLSTGCNGQQHTQNSKYRIQSGRDLTFFTISDTHYLSKSLSDGGPAFHKYLVTGDGKMLNYSNEMMSAFAYDVGIGGPDVILISGDLTSNGEKQSHLDMAEHLKTIENNTGTKVYVIPGNHDLLNSWARQFRGEHQYNTDSVNVKQFRKIYNSLGYGEALLRDKSTLSYLAAPSNDLWLLMLDTAQYLNNSNLKQPQLEGELASSTQQWIDECGKLAAQSGAQIIAVMHHNLLDHSKLVIKGFTIKNNQDVISTLLRNGITTALSGHIHIQDIRSYSQDSKQIHDIASSALSVYPHQYGILKYSPTNRTIDYNTSRLGMELWAKATGNTNLSLLNYNSYSKEFYSSQSAKKTYSQLSLDHRYSSYAPTQLWAMAEVSGKLNELYFSGSENTDYAPILSSEGYRLWMNAPAGELKSKIMWILEQKEKDNSHLHLELR